MDKPPEMFITREPTQIVGSDNNVIPRRNQQCPQCDRYYLTFSNPFFKGDQSVCQACADENFASTREIMQKIERAYADRILPELSYEGPFAALSGVPAQ